MFKNFIERLKNIYKTEMFNKILKHFIKPIVSTLFLSLMFYIIIFNQGSLSFNLDNFFIYFVLVIPLFINICMTYLKLKTKILYGIYGLSVILVPLIAIFIFKIFSMYSYLPEFYRTFNESGLFLVIYLIYSFFFVVGGMFLGLIDEVVFESQTITLKYPDTGTISKSKRRKLKKKKREMAKLANESNKVIDEIMEQSSEEFETESEDPDEAFDEIYENTNKDTNPQNDINNNEDDTNKN